MSAPGLIIAAHKSGAGKTTVTLALLSALTRKGLAVRSAKTGPDYIDPVFHERATDQPCVNLDSWSMPPSLLDGLIAEASARADVLVVEGVMGLFDGVTGEPGRTGVTADLAARFGLPVVLVIDVTSQAQSAGALLRGFATHDPAVHIAGVILNRVASERHERLVAGVIEALRPCRVTRPSPYPSGISASCRRANMTISPQGSKLWPILRKSISILMRSLRWQRRRSSPTI